LQQKFQSSLDQELSIWLARVHTRRQHDNLFILLVAWFLFFFSINLRWLGFELFKFDAFLVYIRRLNICRDR
jgi:D-alanyl-lipoteichoic acid acyltransferase DltB (MBOAT superfamily)